MKRIVAAFLPFVLSSCMIIPQTYFAPTPEYGEFNIVRTGCGVPSPFGPADEMTISLDNNLSVVVHARASKKGTFIRMRLNVPDGIFVSIDENSFRIKDLDSDLELGMSVKTHWGKEITKNGTIYHMPYKFTLFVYSFQFKNFTLTVPIHEVNETPVKFPDITFQKKFGLFLLPLNC